MRVHADTLPDRLLWRVWDAPHCRYIRHLVWADDQTVQWGEGTDDPALYDGDGQWVIHTRQCQRILIRPDIRLIILDPIDDSDLFGGSADACGAASGQDLRRNTAADRRPPVPIDVTHGEPHGN